MYTYQQLPKSINNYPKVQSRRNNQRKPPLLSSAKKSPFEASHSTWSDFLGSWVEMQWAEWWAMLNMSYCWRCRCNPLRLPLMTLSLSLRWHGNPCHFRGSDLPTQSTFFFPWADAGGLKTLMFTAGEVWPKWLQSSDHGTVYVVPNFKASLLFDYCRNRENEGVKLGQHDIRS